MRDLKLDNIRGFLIILVILGHLIQVFTVRSENLFGYIYDIIYAFHMPLFIVVCGMLHNPKGLIEKVSYIVVLYVIFQILSSLRTWYVYGVNFENVISPAFSLWFLMSLATWMVAYHFTEKYKYIFAISILLSLAVGFMSIKGYYFSYMRSISFFPFYVFGAKYMKDISSRFSRQRIAYATLFIIVLISFYLYLFKSLGISYLTPQMASGYYELNGQDIVISLIARILFIFFSLSISIVVFYLFGDYGSFLSRIGRHTLPIYLFQAVSLSVLRLYIPIKYQEFSLAATLIFVIISVLFSFVFGRAFFDLMLRNTAKKIYQPFIRFYVNRTAA